MNLPLDPDETYGDLRAEAHAADRCNCGKLDCESCVYHDNVLCFWCDQRFAEDDLTLVREWGKDRPCCPGCYEFAVENAEPDR